VAHSDEVGFSPTLPPSYSWSAKGEALPIPYEAPQGRRVNAIGAYFPAGPLSGRLVTQSWASLPKGADPAAHGLLPEETGIIDADRFIRFVWQVAGRPAVYASDWRRERPLVLYVDNYSVHKSQAVKAEMPAFEAADVYVVYLPAYSPELSEIEPIWNGVKHRQMQRRSYSQIADLKHAVDSALAVKSDELQQRRFVKTTQLERGAARLHISVHIIPGACKTESGHSVASRSYTKEDRRPRYLRQRNAETWCTGPRSQQRPDHGCDHEDGLTSLLIGR